MSIFHFSMQIIGRNSGRSSTAAAAYRAACRIVDERTGEVHDYTRKTGVREAFILAPESAPAWMHGRSALWNAVERVERRKDAQLCREFEISLPHELPEDERRRLLIEFVKAEFVGLGMVADVAIHKPGKEGDRRNEHAHVLLTMRSIIGDGFGNKNRDWNRWNDADHIENWRSRWAMLVNQALEAHAVSSRIDHRSYERQALAAGHDAIEAQLPTFHLGPKASYLERRGTATKPGSMNRDVQVVNLEVERTKRIVEKELDCQAVEKQPSFKTHAAAENLPTPNAQPSPANTPSRAESIRGELMALLGLPQLPTVAVAREAIKVQRQELDLERAKRIQGNEEVRYRQMRLRRATQDVLGLEQRHSTLQRHGHELKLQIHGLDQQAMKLSRRERAIEKWRDQNPLRARVLDVLQPARLQVETHGGTDDLREAFKRAADEDRKLLEDLVTAREAQNMASKNFEQIQEEVAAQVRLNLEPVSQRLEQAEALAGELQRIELGDLARPTKLSLPEALHPVPHARPRGPAP